MVFVCFGFVLVCVLFSLFTRHFRNPWRLHMVFGKKGSGKSTYLVKIALRSIKKGLAVYTTMTEMLIPGVRLIDINQLGEFVPEKNTVLLCDEVGMIWDNRNFKSFKPEVRDFFKLQRHYHVDVYLASQSFDIDKKLRDLTDDMLLCSNLFTIFALYRPIRKSITLTESVGDQESRIAENLKFKSIFSWRLIYIPKYSKWFDSFDTPSKPYLPYTVIPERGEGETASSGVPTS